MICLTFSNPGKSESREVVGPESRVPSPGQYVVFDEKSFVDHAGSGTHLHARLADRLAETQQPTGRCTYCTYCTTVLCKVVGLEQLVRTWYVSGLVRTGTVQTIRFGMFLCFPITSAMFGDSFGD